MAPTVRSLAAARRVTVRICNSTGEHCGQGLMLALEGEGTVVLTCHHVVARLTEQDLHIAVVQPSGQLGQPVRATYDARRSRPAMDAIVLRIQETGPPERPLLHALDPRTYSGTLPERAVCLGHWRTDSFDARLASATGLDVAVDVPGSWPDPPGRYAPPFVFRLADPSDARPGISGSVVLYENAVLGLAHFSRPAGPDQEREVYLVPLSVWAEGWPALADLIEPLIDARLRSAATVKRARSLEIGMDVSIAGYRPETYVEPAALGQARAALAKHRGVIVVGRPKSGKTRLAWQLLQDRPDLLVVMPHDPRPPGVYETSSLVGKELVLFFDDLHQSALSVDVPEWRRSLEVASQQRCLIVCTSRDGADWKQGEKSGVSRLLDQLGRDAIVYASRVGAEGADLSQADGLRLAQALGIDQADFVKRFDGTPGSLTLDLTDMKGRYQRLRDEERAGIAMTRLLDAAKLVYEASQPRLRAPVLRAAAERIRGEGRLSAEAWDTLQRRTREEGFGLFDSSSGDFRTYKPYLEECVAYSPSVAEVESLIDILIESKDADGLGYLGQALFMRMGSFPAAERALRAAIDLGNSDATSMLGWVIADMPDRKADAEVYYHKRIEAGLVGEYHNLGNLLASQPGREADAAQAYRDAIRSGGDTVRVLSSWSLGNLLIKQDGGEQEAELAYREAKDGGLFVAHRDLARLLAGRPGSEHDAEQAISDALLAIASQRVQLAPEGGAKPAAIPGHVMLDEMRGEVLRFRGIVVGRQQGREAEAESAYREAIALGDADSYLDLAALLANQPGREREAEQAFHDADAAGVEAAQASLGRFLARLPDRAVEAEALIRKAIDGGLRTVAIDLGKLLAEQPGRAQEAEHAFRDAVDAGESEAYEWLGYLAEQQAGREAEAESAYRKAVAAGIADAGMRLGYLLAKQPGREKDAEGVFWGSIERGDRRAWEPLLPLLLKRAVVEGDQSLDGGQEHAIRTEIDAGNAYAGFVLGAFLALQPERSPEGCELVRRAAAAGVELAADFLKEVCGEPAASGG